MTGARVRTLPAAVAPVLAGTGAAAAIGGAHLGRALLATGVALALQVGVNFANDYSDGIRGTDADRVGPARLVGSGAASPATVRAVAFGWFGLAAVAGLALVAATQLWWLLAVGAAAIAAAWFYTGGRRPYGYAGWGEVNVFVFFGLVATCGTTLVQLGRVPAAAWWAAASMGTLASAILVANNLRDRATDAESGKLTLAVRLGDAATRRLYTALAGVAVAGVVGAALTTTPWALLGLAMVPLLARPVRLVLGGATGAPLIGVLKLTGVAELAGAVGLCAGMAIA